MIGYANASAVSGAIYAYDAYGQPNAWSGARLRYAGAMMLPEAQLYHMRARAYAPSLGRFLLDFDGVAAGGGGAGVVVYRDFSPWRGFHGRTRGAVIFHRGVGFDVSAGIVAGWTGSFENLLGNGTYGELAYNQWVSSNVSVPERANFDSGAYQIEIGLSLTTLSGSFGEVRGYEVSASSLKKRRLCRRI